MCAWIPRPIFSEFQVILSLLIFIINWNNLQNCDKCVKAGIARRVDLSSIADPTFKETLEVMLTDLTYYKTAQRKANLFRDQPEKPINRALWWIEYVLRNPDVSHLKSRKLMDMNFVVKHSIDVILIIGSVVALLLFVVLKVILCLVRSSRSSRKIKMQ